MKKYQRFLNVISMDGFKIYNMDDFRHANHPKKITLGLRHDVDNNILAAYKMALMEHEMGLKSTYFILHTAPYYSKWNVNQTLIKKISELGHEIGFHNNLVTVQVFQKKDPVQVLNYFLDRMDKLKITINGTAQHGDALCRQYFYLNDYFFEECLMQPDHFGNIYSVMGFKIKKRLESQCGFIYNCSKIKQDGYRSDAQFMTNFKSKWLDNFCIFSEYQPGHKVQLLIHPCHWEV